MFINLEFRKNPYAGVYNKVIRIISYYNSMYIGQIQTLDVTVILFIR